MRLFIGVWMSSLGVLMLAISAIMVASGGGDAQTWAIVLASTVAADFGLGLASDGWQGDS